MQDQSWHQEEVVRHGIERRALGRGAFDLGGDSLIRRNCASPVPPDERNDGRQYDRTVREVSE